jgi:hypothetical protein
MNGHRLHGHIGESMAGISMKSFYIIQCEIEVEASDDDMALSLLQDTIGFSGFKMVGWINTTLSERESTNDTNNDNQ